MKLLCTKANGWTKQGQEYEIVKEDDYLYWIEVPLPRREGRFELAPVNKDCLKFYCGQPMGIAEFELVEVAA